METKKDYLVKERTVVRLCHKCVHLTEGTTEPEKCSQCGKGFLPLRYFEKVHDHTGEKFETLFAASHQLDEEDLIKGLFVLW